ncbi:BYPASS-related protein [Tanacetum coccineum]
MLVEMTDMTKRAPIGIVKNVLVKIDKFLFPSYFVVIDMLNTCNKTMILGRPFLATIHAKIDVFYKEISLGIKVDMVTFDMDKKIHNFKTHVGKIYMANSIHNDESSTSSNAPSDKYGDNQGSDLIWDIRYAKWCSENSSPNTTSIFTLVQEDCKHRPRDYSFREWLLTKDPRSRSFDDYKWMFKLEIDQLANEYKLGIGKKGHLLDDIWENCKKVQGDNTCWWHDHGLEENERKERGIDIEEYDPPEVHVETFKVLTTRKWNSRGYEFAQDLLVKSSALVIIIWSMWKLEGGGNKKKSLDYNNSFLGEYECSSLALDREEMRDEKKRLNHLKQDQTMQEKPMVAAGGLGGPRYIWGPPGQSKGRHRLTLPFLSFSGEGFIKNASIGARDAGFGRGNQANEGPQG